jgi:hypothetical protein
LHPPLTFQIVDPIAPFTAHNSAHHLGRTLQATPTHPQSDQSWLQNPISQEFLLSAQSAMNRNRTEGRCKPNYPKRSGEARDFADRFQMTAEDSRLSWHNRLLAWTKPRQNNSSYDPSLPCKKGAS